MPGQGFHDPNAPAGYAKKGQRIWGIGYHENELYFGVWVEGQYNQDAARDNELWSVPLDPGTGAFTGAVNANASFYDFAVLQRSFVEYVNSPISDIAFSCDDNIILCTKGVGRDVFFNINAYAHAATTWKIALNNISGPMLQYFVGTYNNSALVIRLVALNFIEFVGLFCHSEP